MRNYDRVHPRKPEGIDERKAYIVGGCKRPAEGKSPEAAADHARDSERHKSDPALYRSIIPSGKKISK